MGFEWLDGLPLLRGNCVKLGPRTPAASPFTGALGRGGILLDVEIALALDTSPCASVPLPLRLGLPFARYSSTSLAVCIGFGRTTDSTVEAGSITR